MCFLGYGRIGFWYLSQTKCYRRTQDRQSPSFDRQPPHHHAGDVEFIELDERRQPIRSERVGHLGRARGVGPDVVAVRGQQVDRTTVSCTASSPVSTSR